MMCNILETAKNGADIFNSTFSRSITVKEFYYKHFCNPNRISIPIRMFYEEGKPVGMNAFMGMYILDNTQNTRHFVTQSNDSAVLPQYRGKHIFSSIVEEYEKTDLECEYCIGIPNENSHKAFLKMGWHNIAELRNLSMKRSKLSLLNQRLNINEGKKVGKNYTYIIGLRYDFSEDELKKINQSAEVITERSNQYINWKISNHCSYVISEYIREVLSGYIIFHVNENRKHGIKYTQICIDDWYYEDKDVLGRLVKEVVKKGYYTYIPLVNKANVEYKDFIDCGFIDDIKRKSSFLIVSPRGIKHNYLEKFSYREVDGDCILNSQ